MPDMLVKLYELPEIESAKSFEKRSGVTIRRAIVPEKHHVTKWVGDRFSAAWASECEVALTRSPATCIIAVQQEELLGFACYDATMKGFFGPTGVSEQARGRGIGKMLLLQTLQFMYSDGYGYAIIGGAGPTDFYTRTCGALPIDRSTPGIYRGMLK